MRKPPFLNSTDYSATSFTARAGVPQSTAMKLTGHKTASVYRRYAIADHVVLEEGVGKLAALQVGAGTQQRSVLPMKKAQ